MEVINGKKVYEPSTIEAYFPKEGNAKSGKWVPVNDPAGLRQAFADGMELIRYTCENYKRVVKVRDNRTEIAKKYAVLVDLKGFDVVFATSLVMKDFGNNTTKWIHKDFNTKLDSVQQEASPKVLAEWGVMEG